MSTRPGLLALAVLLCLTTFGSAQDNDEQLDSLSKMLQESLTAKAPKTFVEKSSGWGNTVPIPERLRLPRLRKRIKVGDHEELPHGAWIKTTVKMDDPAKDIQIRVREMKLVSAGKMKLRVQATVTSSVEREHQQWLKGLLLLVVVSEADTVVVADVDCEANFGLDTSKFPPAFRVKATVQQVRLKLDKFTMRRISPFASGERAEQVGDQMKGVVEALVQSYEADVKEQANKAIAEALKNGSGNLSPKSLLNLPTSPPK